MYNLRVSLRLGLAFGLILILTGAVAYFGLNGLRTVMYMTEIADDANHMIETTYQIRQQEKNFVLRGFSLWQDDTQNATEKLRGLVVEFEDLLADTAGKVAGDEEDSARVEKVKTQLAAYVTAFDEYEATEKHKVVLEDSMTASGQTMLDAIEEIHEEQHGHEHADTVVDESSTGSADHDELSDAPDLMESMLLIRNTELKYRLSGDPSLIDKVHASINDLREVLEDLKGDLDHSDNATQVSTILTALDDYEVAFDTYHAAMDTQALTENAMVNAARTAQIAANELHEDASEDLEIAGASAAKVALLATGLAILIGLSSAIFITRSITKPMSLIVKGSRLLAVGDADLTGIDAKELTKTGERRDELGEVTRAFSDLVGYFRETASISDHIANSDLTAQVRPRGEKDVLARANQQMLENLRSLIELVQDGAGQVAAASQQIGGASEQAAQATQMVAITVQQVANGASQQTKSTTQASSQVDQMTGAIDGIAKGSQEQAHGIERVSVSAAQMLAVVEQVAANAQASAGGL